MLLAYIFRGDGTHGNYHRGGRRRIFSTIGFWGKKWKQQNSSWLEGAANRRLLTTTIQINAGMFREGWERTYDHRELQEGRHSIVMWAVKVGDGIKIIQNRSHHQINYFPSRFTYLDKILCMPRWTPHRDEVAKRGVVLDTIAMAMLLELSFGFAMVLLLFAVGQGTLWAPSTISE